MREVTFDFRRREPSNVEIDGALLQVYLLAKEASMNVYGECPFSIEDVVDGSIYVGTALEFPDDTYFVEFEGDMVYIDRVFFIQGIRENVFAVVHRADEENCIFIELR